MSTQWGTLSDALNVVFARNQDGGI